MIVWAVSDQRVLTPAHLRRALSEISKIVGRVPDHVYLLPIAKPTLTQRFKKAMRWFSDARRPPLEKDSLIECSSSDLSSVQERFLTCERADVDVYRQLLRELKTTDLVVVCGSDTFVLGLGGPSVVTIPENPVNVQALQLKSVMLPIVNPEYMEEFFFAALYYAKRHGLGLNLYFKSPLSTDPLLQNASLYGSQSPSMSEQYRVSILTEWLHYATEVGVPIAIQSDRTRESLGKAMLSQIQASAYDFVLIEKDFADSYFWRKVMTQIATKSRIPVLFTTPSVLMNQHALEQADRSGVDRTESQAPAWAA